MAKLRIGFVGVGGMGQAAHLRNYAALKDECEVVALAEIRPRLAARVAAKYEVPRVYPDADTLLSEEKLDGIVASQPFDRHGQLLPSLYKAGVPLFTEKPIAASVAVGEALVAALEQSGSWHMVGYHKRSDPATMWAKAEIDRLKESGELGPLRYVRILMPPGDWVAGGFYDNLYSDEPSPPLDRDPPASDMDAATFAEYVSFVNYYIHQVNLLRHLFGESYRVSYADPSGVLLAVHSESGVCGTIEMAPYETTQDWQESALVAFHHGWIRVEFPAPVALNQAGRVTAFRDPKGGSPETLSPTLPPVHAMRQQARNFLAAIRGERPPMCQAAEALEDLRIARDYLRVKQGGVSA